MTPYEPNKQVIIDPTNGFKNLTFGALDEKKFKGRIGKIKKQEYWTLKRTMTYLVEFNDELGQEELWFTEKEIG